MQRFFVFLQRGSSRTLDAQVLWLFCRGRPSQHLKFDIELYLLVIKLACESQLTEMLFKLLIIKLACESQLTEMLFKLLIKLACESQLTEMLFKLLIIKLACESQLTEILFKLIIIILLRLNLQL